LSFFAHEHPERVGPATFRLTTLFPAPGRYRVYADVAPKDAGAQVLSGEVLVSGLVVRDADPAPAPRSAVSLSLPEGGVPGGSARHGHRRGDRSGRPAGDGPRAVARRDGASAPGEPRGLVVRARASRRPRERDRKGRRDSVSRAAAGAGRVQGLAAGPARRT